MIFVTVGNMDPFDRLIQAIDKWVTDHAIVEEVFAQIGLGSYHPQNCKHVKFLTPLEYRDVFSRARVIVSHAGMGTIITALELQKQIIVMPKRASLGEQRNEHQLATVRHFKRSRHVLVADSELELPHILQEQMRTETQFQNTDETPTGLAEWPPDPLLINFVRSFVLN